MSKKTAEQAAVNLTFLSGVSTARPTAEQAEKKTGRPAKAPGEKMIPVPVRMTPAQRDKLKRIGAQRFRDWLDRVKE
jgi:hypothetical protein